MSALLADPPQATVKAKTDVKVLAISREHFSQVLAPAEEILKRHISDYKYLLVLLLANSSLQ